MHHMLCEALLAKPPAGCRIPLSSSSRFTLLDLSPSTNALPPKKTRSRPSGDHAGTAGANSFQLRGLITYDSAILVNSDPSLRTV